MCNRATSQPSGTSPDVLGVFVMFKDLADIPSIVWYRRIILLARTRSHDVVQRHLIVKTKDIPHDVPQGCAMIVRRRVMVVRWACVKL